MKPIICLILLIIFSQNVYSADITVDGTVCNLGDAIEAANTDSVVGGCDATAGGADVLSLLSHYSSSVADTTRSTSQLLAYAALPDIVSDITIVGDTDSYRKIERDASLICESQVQADEFRLFQVLNGGHLTLSGIEINNGCADAGAGILVLDGQLSTNQVSFANNTSIRSEFVAQPVIGGGALAVFDASAVVQIEATLFQENIANNLTSGHIEGGAINVELASNINVTNTLFDNNQVFNNQSTAKGGALYVNIAEINISQSIFIANQVSAKTANGGAIYIESDGILSELSDSEFIGNMASSTISTGVSGGGAIFMNYNDGALLSNLIFKQNKAEASSRGAQGGAIFNFGSNISLSQAYFFENKTESGSDSGGAFGGAIFSDPGMALMNVTFENNTAQGGNTSTGNGNKANGGALFSCELPLSYGLTFTGNQAIGGNSDMANGGDAEGGAVDTNCGPYELHNATFFNNKAIAGIGAIANGTAEGGGLMVNDTLIEISSSIFENNTSEVDGMISNSDCYEGTGNPAALMSQGYNMVGDAGNCIFTGPSDQIGVSASLMPLADNGCSTPLPDGTCLRTHAIDINSNALDQGSCTSSGSTTDARGFARPFDDTNTSNADDGCDVGAFEYQYFDNPDIIFIHGFE